MQHNIDMEIIGITQGLMAESGEPYRREIKLDSSLQRHLGIDSLGRAELFRRIEKKFDITLPDRLLAEAETLNDIVVFIREAKPRLNQPVQREVMASHGERPQLDLGKASTLQDILYMYGEHSPDKTHIYFQHEDGTDEVISYGHLLKTAQRVAYSLRERGLKEGETVAIMLPTTPGFFYAFYGILLAGGIPVPIYPPFRMHMLEAYAKTEARILRNAEVRMLITFEQAEKLSRLLQGFVPSLKEVATVDQLMQPHEISHLYHAKSDDPAFIQYTSGSTSDPKGVLLSHYNLLSNIRAYGKAVQVKPDDVIVSWLPLYHDFGLIGSWLGSLYHGVPLILMTPFSFLSHPERWLWAIHYHRGTISCAPNFAYELCIRKVDPALIEGLDLSSWRIAANGAEKVYPRTLEGFTEKFAPYGFSKTTMMPVYGLAESTVGLTIPPVGRGYLIDRVDRKAFEEERQALPSTSKQALEFVSSGGPIEDHEIRIVDEVDNVLPERHIGTLQFRGPSNMQGYYNNPRATRAALHDGWIDSGDLAYEVEGEVYITGRRKDLIIKAGRNLYPVEIEELVGSVPGVRQGCVAAFGVTNPENGTEELVIVAETREKRKAESAKIISDITDAVASALDITPDHIKLTSPKSVPKTSSGKLQRAACKAMYLEGKLGKFHIPASLQMVKLAIEWTAQRLLDGIKAIAKCIYTAYMLILVVATALPVYVAARYASAATTAKLVRFGARLLLFFGLSPLRIMGKENFATDKPVIYAANHASYMDAAIALAIMPPGTRFVAKKELFSLPIIGTYMKKMGYLSVDRTSLPRGLEDTVEIESALKNGHSVLIFPEGTFGYAAGLRPFRLGAFKIATETGVPIVPVAIRGARKLLRDGSWLMQPNRIRVTVCEPVLPVGNDWQDITRLRQTVRTKVAQFCGETSLDLIAAQTVAPKPPKR
jgi:fatty-acyl-CoA synthase